ncbi:hypothetical protein BBO99_00004780 [Phytophthora kernoviae]|uniref:non-specific serine/threonine protein kinase n=1 Tax=Phytophthora kernoviae TaxID=325452 RepID=A0A3R7IGU7_9STRA|nr:hypothetical protein BBI17_004879 [Phytophthora kernoviae]RLN80073.1 hypothetical protein BBO99_00004780 [Phytophthora kernoviae]
MVFRVLSLWFNNQRKADINRIVAEEVIDVVPSYKFVPLSYQIISRVSSIIDGDTFQAALRKLVMKLSEQHPHHTLVQLIALKNSGAVEGKGALQFRTNVGDAKSEGAKVYLDELQRTEQRELLASLDIMADAYVQLALLDTRQYHTQKKKIPLSKVQIIAPNSTKTGTVAFDQCLRDRSRRANRVVMPAVLTSRIAPQPDMDYSNVARMLSFEPQFSITDSGIHRPKIIYCYGSDGHRYKQLVKGQDDTRQDLVIEQVFDTMNQFLMEERATRYTQSAAVTSIVGYILGIGDRHSQNILIHEDTGELVHIDFGVVFDQGMALFTPETVPFRLTRDMVDGMGVSGVDGVFTRSCEVTLQLLRKKSASVVTILEVFVHDPLYRWTLSPLKALRIQEGEQDVVRSATLSRTSSRSTNSSVVNDTGGSSNETQPAYGNKAGPSSNDAAARALIRVKQKLEGYEDPNGNALSIEGQVKHLMSVAQDPHNLCVLFPGWAPWL